MDIYEQPGTDNQRLVGKHIPVPEDDTSSRAGVQLEMISGENIGLFRYIEDLGRNAKEYLKDPKDTVGFDWYITPAKIDDMVTSLRLTAGDLEEILSLDKIFAFACRRGSYRSAIGTAIAEELGKKVIQNNNPALGSTGEPDELGYGFGLDCIAENPGSLRLDDEGYLIIDGKRVEVLVIFLDFNLKLDFCAFTEFIKIYEELDPTWSVGRTKITVFEEAPEIFVGGLLLAFPSPNIEAFPEVPDNIDLKRAVNLIRDAWPKP